MTNSPAPGTQGSNMHGLSGTAIVTGTSSGIGLATAHLLLRQGMRVIGIDRDAPALTDTFLLHEDASFISITGEATDPDVLRQALSYADDLVCAVSCAGDIAGGRAVWEHSHSDYMDAFQANALPVVALAQAVIPVMLSSANPARCRFVAVTSAAGERGLFHLGPYVAAKHAATGIIRTLAHDLVGTGIAAIAVSPGSTQTPLLERTAQLYDVTSDELAQQQFIRRALQPDEIAEVIAMCCGPSGAALNGSIVHADGGFHG